MSPFLWRTTPRKTDMRLDNLRAAAARRQVKKLAAGQPRKAGNYTLAPVGKAGSALACGAKAA